MTPFHTMLNFKIIVFGLCIALVHGSRSGYYNQWSSMTYPPTGTAYGRSRRRALRLHNSNPTSLATTMMVARRKNKPEDAPPMNPGGQDMDPKSESNVNFDDLGPFGKTIAGVTQVVVTTVLEYVQGFVAGFTLGTVVGVPGFFVRPVDPAMPRLFYAEARERFSRMNSRSMRWATTWGGISAAFGGFSIAVKVIRNGREDDWNSILSSAAAGAFFARAEGPQAMLKGALLYGGMIYVFSGGLGKKSLTRYTEEPVAEF